VAGKCDLSVSILTTSYNQLPVLRLLVASLERQTVRDFEIVVADDGSSDGTAEYCASKTGTNLVFVTQSDEGYRKSRILNEALKRCSGDYLIFLDSDVILEKHFVEDHLALRKSDSFVCGRRVDLGPEITVSEERILAGDFDHIWNPDLLRSVLNKKTLGIKRGLRVCAPLLRKLMRYDRPIDILGSNFSAWKKDILAVNGFNEGLESYWGEDGDLFIRLRNSGKKAVNAKGMCVQFHLFHKRREPNSEVVERITALVKNTDYKWAEKGYRSRF